MDRKTYDALLKLGFCVAQLHRAVLYMAIRRDSDATENLEKVGEQLQEFADMMAPDEEK